MEGARCIVVLCLLAATLSLHSVSCKPLNFQGVNRFFPTRTSVPTKSLTYSPMPVPGFSPYPDPYASRGPYRQNYGNGFDPFSREQAVDSDAQFVGLGIGAARLGYEALKAAGRVALKYWPDVRECINSFVNLNDPNDEMSLQNDREALVNELESMWKRGVEYKAREEMFNEQASKYWPLISDCIDRFVDRASGDDTGRETAEQQGVRRAAKNLLLNYAVSRLPNQRGPNGNVQETSEPRANEQFWETLAPILLNYGLNKWRENQNENDGNNGKLQANANIARGRGTSSLTPRAQVQRNYAAMQGRFSNLFNAENWNIGKECLNDVFGDTDDGRMTPREQAAMVSEFESVWRGQTDLSMASAQVRLNWGTVRDCIDRFANKDNPTAAASSLFSRIGGLFNSGNWEIARECLNDVFGDSDDSGMTAREQAAVISEFESVWKGQTDLSTASAQVGLNWGTVRDCVDRFVNKDNPTSTSFQCKYCICTHPILEIKFISYCN